jgi:hypothetical protein
VSGSRIKQGDKNVNFSEAMDKKDVDPMAQEFNAEKNISAFFSSSSLEGAFPILSSFC